MSIEEKAKAYDEAFSKAKRLYEGKDKTPKEPILEYLFPQLRESEDERIRKALIDALKVSETIGELKFRLPYPTREECIAYLEKQKEQKHPNGCFTCDEYKKGYEAGRLNGFTAGYNKAMKEQKSAWSEENEKIMDTIVSVLGQYIDYKAVSGTGTGYATPRYSKEIDWLKSLRPQPREEIYQSAKHDLAIKFMNYLDENRPEGKMSLSNGECEDIDKAFKENDWAKIMRYVEKYRPSWKPSKEQEEPEYYQHFDPDC